jgi:hypothetical protein
MFQLLGPHIVVLASVALLQAPSAEPQPAPAIPADIFMHAIETRDGELGWRQLCPPVQAEIPLAQVIQVTAAARAADAKVGLTLSVDFVSAQDRPAGGQVRTYHAIARRADGQADEKMFVVQTQASGCVEAIE